MMSCWNWNRGGGGRESQGIRELFLRWFESPLERNTPQKFHIDTKDGHFKKESPFPCI